MSILQNSIVPVGAPGGYDIPNSLRFNDNDSAYLSRTPSSAGNRKTWTWSGWVKRGNLGTHQRLLSCNREAGNENRVECRFGDDDKLNIEIVIGAVGYTTTTSSVYRDASAWYHIVLVVNTTEAVSSNRVKIYVNNIEASYSSQSVPNQHADTEINNNIQHGLGHSVSYGAYFDGHMAEVNFIDGQALDPSNFGETGDYGEWKPIKYTGTYGTNGFYLPFENDYTVEGFSTVTYTGNGSDQYVGGVGFQPDLVWVKNRNSTQNHFIMNTVTPNEFIIANMTNPADTNAGYHLTHNPDGFTQQGSAIAMNTNGNTYVAWCWDMGGSNATNNDGTITSTVRANTTYGQSIVSYTGTGSAGTVGHGLSSAPEMVIVKLRSASGADWKVQHIGLSDANKVVYLNSSMAENTESDKFGAWAGATTFPLNGSHASVNGSGHTYIAYCFHSVAGYSKFGSYTGNGASGNTITTGFAPAFVMTKRTDGVGDWRMWDNTRDPNNPTTPHLLANSNSAENTSLSLDFTSTGFQLNSSDSEYNANGGSYIYMAFADKREAALWLDQSGNNNDWTANNLTESDIMLDTPTNNFCTLNAVDSDATLSEGNLEANCPNGGVTSTFPVSSGKWYLEFLMLTQGGTLNGWVEASYSASTSIMPHDHGDNAMFYTSTAQKVIDNAFTAYGSTIAANDIVGVAVDLDGNTIQFYKNGVSQGSFSKTFNGQYIYTVSDVTTATNSVSVHNFGQDSSFAGNKIAQGNSDGNGYGDFYYAPPSGYLALCTQNLPDATVIPSEHFNTVLYTGNGSNGHSITGVGFTPDFVWVKRRSAVEYHLLADTMRGDAKILHSNVTSAEYTQSLIFNSLDSDGITVGTDNSTNASGSTYVAWNWKANGSGVSNTDGTITSTVSANTNAGFSIVSYTGTGSNATIGHGLNSAPEIVITKSRDASRSWSVLTSVAGYSWASGYLDSAGSFGDASSIGAPTSSVLNVQSQVVLNSSGEKYIAYCFHSVDGYSKVGSYTGNGSTDGTFVYTGFRPAYVLVKCTSAADSWVLKDTERNPSNVAVNHLYPNLSNAEESGTGGYMDILSNGFKWRASWGGVNGSGLNYIFIAFAEVPAKFSNAR